jgi:DNA repair protein RadC
MSCVANSHSAFDLLKQEFNSDVEEFWGVFLNNHLDVIDFKLIHRGTMDACTVHPRDLFREAIKLNSCAVIIAHNHPSRNVDPSTADIRLTKKFQKIGLLIQIPVIDHVIFSDINYFSFKQHRLI